MLLIADALERASDSAQGTEPPSGSTFLSLVSAWRWYWIPALYPLTLLFVLMITLTQEGGVGQMMYRAF